MTCEDQAEDVEMTVLLAERSIECVRQGAVAPSTGQPSFQCCFTAYRLRLCSFSLGWSSKSCVRARSCLGLLT